MDGDLSHSPGWWLRSAWRWSAKELVQGKCGGFGPIAVMCESRCFSGKAVHTSCLGISPTHHSSRTKSCNFHATRNYCCTHSQRKLCLPTLATPPPSSCMSRQKGAEGDTGKEEKSSIYVEDICCFASEMRCRKCAVVSSMLLSSHLYLSHLFCFSLSPSFLSVSGCQARRERAKDWKIARSR